MNSRARMGRLVKDNLVPIIFTALCVASLVISGLRASFVVNETIARLSRNMVLVVSLVLPVLCGMGLNFSIVLGAMAGEVGMILITHWNIDGLPGIMLAMVIGTIVAVGLGWLTGRLFNRVKGQEMITGMILGFFAVGVYDLVFLYMVGGIIPMVNPKIMLSQQTATGETTYVGLRNTIDFHPATKYAIDNAFKVPFLALLPWLLAGVAALTVGIIIYKTAKAKRPIREVLFSTKEWLISTALLAVLQVLVGSVGAVRDALFIAQIPLLTVAVIVAVCAFVLFITRTKLGHDIRTVGMNMQVATSAGIDVDKTRIIATILSTMIASWGQIISLQNIGNVQTFNSHEQVGTYAVAALLVGGASIDKASMGQVFMGTLLFHVLFFTTPLAGKALFNDPQLGEYFRVFLCYGIIAVSLVLYAWKKNAAHKRRAEMESKQVFGEM